MQIKWNADAEQEIIVTEIATRKADAEKAQTDIEALTRDAKVDVGKAKIAENSRLRPHTKRKREYEADDEPATKKAQSKVVTIAALQHAREHEKGPKSDAEGEEANIEMKEADIEMQDARKPTGM